MPYLGGIRLPGSNLIDPRRELANAMLASSVQRRPERSWTQGAARMMQALVGTHLNNLSKQDQDKALEGMMSGFADKTVTHAPIPNPQVKELESQAQTALGAAQDHMDQFGGIDNQGLGFQMTGDAQNLMRRASDLPEQITPEPTVIPGSTDRALQKLGALKGNVYAQNLYQQLLVQKMAEQQEERRYQRGRKDGMADFKEQLEIRKSYEPPPPAYSTVQSPYGLGGVGQQDQFGKIVNYQSPQKPTERRIVKGQDGANYYTDTGERVFPNAKAIPKDDRTATQKNYQAAVAQGYTGSLMDYQTALKKAGAMHLNPLEQAKLDSLNVKTDQLKKKESQAGTKAANALKAFVRKTQTLSSTIDQAIKLAKEGGPPVLGTTGFGDALSGVYGTDARSLEKTLDTIRGNLGFDELQRMRDNSPTGGALGQVSEMENRLLQSVLGALDQGGDKAVLIQNLEKIKELYKAVLNEKMGAYRTDYGEPQNRRAGDADESPVASSGGFKFLGEKK